MRFGFAGLLFAEKEIKHVKVFNKVQQLLLNFFSLRSKFLQFTSYDNVDSCEESLFLFAPPHTEVREQGHIQKRTPVADRFQSSPRTLQQGTFLPTQLQSGFLVHGHSPCAQHPPAAQAHQKYWSFCHVNLTTKYVASCNYSGVCLWCC